MRTPGTESLSRGLRPLDGRICSGGLRSPETGIRGSIFLYGTLLEARTLARQSGDGTLHRRAIPAMLHGYRRGRLRGTPFPTLLPDPGGHVQGLLIRPTAKALARLHAYEGPPYRLVPLRVETRRGIRWARAWAVPRWRAA